VDAIFPDKDSPVDRARSEKARAFLKTFKKVASRQGVFIVNREVNQKALAELGLTSQNRSDEILSLSVADYCSGPEKDRDRLGDVWIFGKEIGDKEVYIKLKIAVIKDAHQGENEIAKCISFHRAERPLTFPCCEKGRGLKS
jgi:hypothetical protein